MSQTELQRLISMANQISRNSHMDNKTEAVAFVASHLQRFWSRSMKEKLCAYAQADGAELDEYTREAVKILS